MSLVSYLLEFNEIKLTFHNSAKTWAVELAPISRRFDMLCNLYSRPPFVMILKYRHRVLGIHWFRCFVADAVTLCVYLAGCIAKT